MHFEHDGAAFLQRQRRVWQLHFKLNLPRTKSVSKRQIAEAVTLASIFSGGKFHCELNRLGLKRPEEKSSNRLVEPWANGTFGIQSACLDCIGAIACFIHRVAHA